ncbi:hypothetical protein GCM10011446_08750 [Acinetobacter vivianii]|nr:hypothetical protein GCM10011446_08750 [Acinetobacter vivianii]
MKVKNRKQTNLIFSHKLSKSKNTAFIGGLFLEIVPINNLSKGSNNNQTINMSFYKNASYEEFHNCRIIT